MIAPPASAWRLEDFSELPSTSDFCIARAKAGEAAGLAVFAARQSAGRGSRGREWISPPGNMALSVLLRPDITPAQSGMFPLLAGLAGVKAIEQAAPEAKPLLKWPNDVLIAGAKCAGLLIDAAPLQNRVDWLVIGIGINVGYAPEVPGRAITCLAAHGATLSARDVAALVLGELGRQLQVFEEFGPAGIVPAWVAHAHPVGAELVVKTADSAVAGRFAGLTPAGELQLLVQDRIEKFSTGEIFWGAA
jgi:BirA family biotin operon repressor/biotin-[acetyl-CoA-carboxylase] ligase